MLKKFRNLLNFSVGAIALPAVLMIGGIIIEIAVSGVFIIYYISQSGYGVRLSSEALAAAQSGIHDGIMKIVRNKNIDYNTSDSPYTVTVGGRTSQVIICKDTKTVSSACDTVNAGKHEITSLGSAFNKRRELRAIINVDSYTGEAKFESIQEIAI